MTLNFVCALLVKLLTLVFMSSLCSKLRVPFPTTREAEIAHGSLSVDAEPRRGEVMKTLSVSGQVLTVYVTNISVVTYWCPIHACSLVS